MRKDVREFIRRLEAVGLTIEPTPGHYRVQRDGKPLRKANGMPFTLPFSPDTTQSAGAELRSPNCASSASACSTGPQMPKPADLSVTGPRQRHVPTPHLHLSSCSCGSSTSSER
jgi:hypothetical protein